MPQPSAQKISRLRYQQLLGALSTEFDLLQERNEEFLAENKRLTLALFSRAPIESPRFSPPATECTEDSLYKLAREATLLSLQSKDNGCPLHSREGTTASGQLQPLPGDDCDPNGDGQLLAVGCAPSQPSQRAPCKVQPKEAKAALADLDVSPDVDIDFIAADTSPKAMIAMSGSDIVSGEESSGRADTSTVKSKVAELNLKGMSVREVHENLLQRQNKSSSGGIGRKSEAARVALQERPDTINMLLDTVPSLVILANALKIGLSADIEPEHRIWDILETFFITCFLFEAMLKFWLWGCKRYFCGEQKYWNWFDFTCLSISLFDLSMTYFLKLTDGGGSGGLSVQMFKFLRLARLARLVRALHFKFFDELRTMVLGVFSGVKVLFWAIILLFFVIFFLGVFMNSMVGDSEPEFDSVPDAMLSIFRCYTDGCVGFDGRPLPARLFENYGALFFLGYILSFMLVTVGIFNLIMAIFIDNVVSAGVHRKLEEIGEKSERVEAALKEHFADAVGELHGIHNGTARYSVLKRASACVTRTDFTSMLANPRLEFLFDFADIETSDRTSLFDVLDVDMGGELEMEELVDGLMSLRGPMTKTDIVSVKLKVRYITKMIEDMWRKMGFDGEDWDD